MAATTFDGVPIDVNVAFPPEPTGGPDGDYPLVMLFRGYGGGKLGLDTMQRFLDAGYATLSMTDRGFRESCGSAASQAADRDGARLPARSLRLPVLAETTSAEATGAAVQVVGIRKRCRR